MKCHDLLSGERFDVEPDGDVPDQIEEYIQDGIDQDTGSVEYRVETDAGEMYVGIVEPK